MTKLRRKWITPFNKKDLIDRKIEYITVKDFLIPKPSPQTREEFEEEYPSCLQLGVLIKESNDDKTQDN